MNPIKTSRQEWIAFGNPDNDKEWCGDWSMEDEVLTVNGVEGDGDSVHHASDSDTIVLVSGTIFKGDRGHADLLPYFKRWRSRQTVVHLAVSVPKDKEAEFLKLLKSCGGKKL